MNAIWLTLLVSLVLAFLGVLLFWRSHRDRTRDHVDRLALLPLEDDPVTPVSTAAAPAASPLAPSEGPLR
jgi:hypothetical protein